MEIRAAVGVRATTKSQKTEKAKEAGLAVAAKAQVSDSPSKDSASFSTQAEQRDQSMFGKMKELATLARSGGAVKSAIGLFPGPDLKLAKDAGEVLNNVADRVMNKVGAYRDQMAQRNIDQTTTRNAEIDKKSGDELATMKNGSKRTFGGKAAGHVRNVGGEQEIQFEMERREDGKYVVSRNLGAGVLAKKDKAKGTLNVKVKDEYVFDNPQDAARAERVLAESTRKDMMTGIRADLPGEAELRKRDADFLKANRSSFSITGAGAAEYAQKLGLPLKGDDKINLGQIAGRGNGEVELKFNYEKDPDGGPARAKALEVNVSTGVEVDVEAQPGGRNDKLAEMYAKAPGAKTNAKFTVSTTMPLPDGLTAENLLENPASLQEHVQQMREQSKTKVTAQHTYDLLGKSGRVTTAEFEPTGDREKDTETLQKILSGRPDVLRAGPGKLTVKSQTYEKNGTQVGGEIDIKIAGYELSYENTETQFSPTETWVDQQPVG